MVHQIGQQTIFLRGELHRIAVDGDPAGAGVDAHRPAGDFALGVAGRTAQQRAHPRQHLLEMKRLGDIIVGAGIEARTLSLQRSRAVRISTGMVRPARRQASSTEMPSIFGRPISRMTAS